MVSEKQADAVEALLDAAEIAFGESGFEGASLREIMRRAEVHSSAVHHHFGSKQALYESVLRRRLASINDDRAVRLARVRGSRYRGRRRLTELLFAYMAPHMHVAASPRGEAYSRLLARFDLESVRVTAAVYRDYISPTRDEFLEELGACLPSLGREDLFRGFSFCLGLMAMGPIDSGYSSFAARSAIPDDPDVFAKSLAEFCSAGLLRWSKRSDTRP